MKQPVITLFMTINILSFQQCKDIDLPESGVTKSDLIAISEWDSSMKSHIFTMNADGTAKKQLTHGSTEYWMPAWSPDGKKIVYASKFSSGQSTYIFTMDAEGGNQTQLTFSEISMAPCWSPDGSKIAFAHITPGDNGFDIWVMNTDGSGVHPLIDNTNIDENVPTWSPDGKKIAFTSNRNGGHYQLWSFNLNDSALTQLTTAVYDSTYSNWIEQKVPTYSPDGNYLAFWEGVEGSNSTSGLPWNICIMNTDGTNKRILGRGDDPVWSPDSKTIIRPFKTICPGSVSINGIKPDGTNDTLQFITNCGFGRMSWKNEK